ncbi:MAG: ATP-grasp domain-containing protein [Methylococcaceae bacterium]|nr:ATP-grasp domain-containing protein [Methylococcaceae bacterium]
MSAAAASAPVAGAAVIRPRVLVIAPKDSYRTAPYIESALAIGIDVLIASEGRHSLVSALAQGLHIDLNDPSGSLDLIEKEARNGSFQGIVATDDSTTEMASLAARRLGLPHNRPEAVRIARRKDFARGTLQAASIQVPDFRCICLDRLIENQIEDFPFPCVVKPLAMSGSRGVIRCDDREQFRKAVRRVEGIIADAADESERRNILVEAFIPGFEIAVEGILRHGDLDVLAIFDKPDPLNGPYFEETYYITPTRLAAEVRDRVRVQVEKACRAYGLAEGPVHAECRINQEGVWMLELAARTIGGLCNRLFRYGVGSCLEELVLYHAIGVPLERPEMTDAAGVLMIPIPKAGVLRRVEGVSAAAAVPFIQEVVIQVREGYELIPLPEGSSYLGFIFAVAPDAQKAEQALRDAHARLNIVVAPLWKGVLLAG